LYLHEAKLQENSRKAISFSNSDWLSKDIFLDKCLIYRN
jgi:hypothetical protein